MPTFSAPRFLIVSTTLSDESCCWALCATAPVATAMPSAAAIPNFKPASVNLIAFSLLSWW